ncbi:MAG: hypothetical protein H0U05_06105 [Actinobacteria bacterium]|nr:hypothetical protein [Actinomycetota bacterium]
MYVRIARFEGGDLTDPTAAVERVRNMMQGDRPPGLEKAKRLLMLVDRENGRGLGLTFFETEQDMREGDRALDQMTPGDEAGKRTAVEMYEIGLDQEFGG